MNTPRLHADWFTRITGFSERSYQDTQALLRVEDEQLISSVNSKRWVVGTLEVRSMAHLPARATVTKCHRSTLQPITGDVRALHRDTRFAGALFPGRIAVQPARDGRPQRETRTRRDARARDARALHRIGMNLLAF